MIDFLKEKIQLKERDEVIKLHIIIKCFEKNINLSDADINCLLELNRTGYNTEFYKNCVNNKYYKSEQTVRNAIARMTNLGILFSNKRRGQKFFTKDFILNISNDKVIVQYLIGNP